MAPALNSVAAIGTAAGIAATAGRSPSSSADTITAIDRRQCGNGPERGHFFGCSICRHCEQQSDEAIHALIPCRCEAGIHTALVFRQRGNRGAILVVKSDMQRVEIGL